MKKTIFFLLLAIASLTAFSQANYNIVGKIVDAATKLPLEGASVFAENTTLGTATNTAGTFALQLPNGGYNLVITFTGYQTETKRITTADAGSPVMVELKQKEKSMEDVVIRATNEVTDGWEKYGEFFLDNFIGKTDNSRQCTIKNKEVLKFYFYKRKNRLKILATEPVEIVNNALGYTVKYTLDSFVHEYNTQVSLYSGYPLFKEIEPADEAQRNLWKTNRQIAYNGSILHFMRSMYNKKLKEEGFEIQFLVKNNGRESAVPLKNFYSAMNYSVDDTAKTVEVMPNQQEVAILYKNESPSKLYLDTNTDVSPKFQLSVVSFLPNESVVIEQNGYYYEQNDITINGYWAWEKVGDMLPYNFSINANTEAAVAKEAVMQATPAPVIIEQTNAPLDLLTSVAWKAQESRIIDGTNTFYYKRGGQENTINLDNDLYKFNTDNTGIYFFNGQEYKFNWSYDDDKKTKITMTIQYPTPLIVNLQDIVITASSFTYTRLQKVNGASTVAMETRAVK